MQSNEEIAPRPLPSWLSIPIILVCLGGGGWIIHWYLMTDGLTEESHLIGDAPAAPARQQPQGGGNNRRGPGGGPGGPGGGVNGFVRETRDGTLIFRGKVGTARANITEAKHAVHVTYSDYNGDFAGNDIKTINEAKLLTEGGDKAKAAAMKLTDEQMQKLRGLGNVPEASLTVPQRDQIIAAFTAYKAAGNDPQKQQSAIDKLRQIIDETATQAMPATRAAIADRAKKINDLITPQQWKIDADMGGGK